MFTEKEVAYMESQPLARLATVDQEMQPDNSAVSFEYNGKYFFIGGRNLSTTRKYKNVEMGNIKMALIIDDLESVEPWKPRGIRIFGTARIVNRVGRFGPGDYISIKPTISWSWNIEGPSMVEGRFKPHRTVHS